MKVVKWKSRHTCTIWRGNRRLFSKFFKKYWYIQKCKKTRKFCHRIYSFLHRSRRMSDLPFSFSHRPLALFDARLYMRRISISLIIDRNAFSPFSSPPPGCLQTWGKGREKPLETSSALATATRIDWSRHNFRTGEICAHRRFPIPECFSTWTNSREHSRFPISQLQVRELNVSGLAGKLISKTTSDDEPYYCRKRFFSSLSYFFEIAVHV